jgi:hypothetical protein
MSAHDGDCISWHGWPNPCTCGVGGTQPAPITVKIDVEGSADE